MSSFRLICLAALTVAMVVFVLDGATAQSVADQSGQRYLAGLRPPHEHHTAVHAKANHLSAQHKAATKIEQSATRRRLTVTASAKTHRPARLAEKINSHVAWPSVEPAATNERTTPESVLQFATEESEQAPVAAPRPAPPTPVSSAAKPARPAKITATDEPSDSAVIDKTPTASTPVRTERFEAPAPSQMRVIMPAPSAEPVAAPAPKDQPPARSSSTTAPLLATLAGAITAGIVGWLMIGFGSVRTMKSRQT